MAGCLCKTHWSFFIGSWFLEHEKGVDVDGEGDGDEG